MVSSCPLNQDELASLVGCSKVKVNNLLKELVNDGYVENVITHGNYREKGYATACLNYAKQIAEKNHCYKMMLLTGSKKEKTLNFYRNARYNSIYTMD